MTEPDSQPSSGGGRVFALAAVLAVVGGAAGWFFATRNTTTTPPAQVDLAFLNLGADATYVGSDACKTCHTDEHKGHGGTPHGRSLRKLDAKDLPADALPGRLEHAPSGLSYRMALKDGLVHVREVLPLEAGGEELLGDHVLTHAFGSGEHAQCYLAEPDGFLVQAPIARAQGAWAMAPEYDSPLHGSFGRPIGRTCLGCHGGRATTEDDSLHRVTFQEMAIGCERCHGPGSVHVAHQEKLALAGEPAKRGSPEPDLTIVNPSRLTQARSVEVCTQCHADEGMTVQRSGRTMLDWRPGIPLADYRITYRPKTPTGAVPRIGHGEQLRASKCFQASPTMNCSTCHDAHGRPGPAERAAHYSNKCASCHGADGCRLDAAARRQSEGGDDCTTCHMPRAEAYVPHGTFTHHRVGIHLPGASGDLAVGEQLELALLEEAELADRPLGEAERDSALAHLRLLAWHPAGRVPAGGWLSPMVTGNARKQAMRGLTKAEGMESLDADAKIALAMLIARTDTEKATRLLTSALEGEEPLRDETRVAAHFLLATALFERALVEEARPIVERLTRLRRSHEDWELMSVIERTRKNNAEAVTRTLQKVLAIRPHVESTHFLATELLTYLGDPKRQAHHQAIAQQLSRHLAAERQKAELRRAPPK